MLPRCSRVFCVFTLITVIHGSAAHGEGQSAESVSQIIREAEEKGTVGANFEAVFRRDANQIERRLDNRVSDTDIPSDFLEDITTRFQVDDITTADGAPGHKDVHIKVTVWSFCSQHVRQGVATNAAGFPEPSRQVMSRTGNAVIGDLSLSATDADAKEIIAALASNQNMVGLKWTIKSFLPRSEDNGIERVAFTGVVDGYNLIRSAPRLDVTKLKLTQLTPTQRKWITALTSGSAVVNSESELKQIEALIAADVDQFAKSAGNEDRKPYQQLVERSAARQSRYGPGPCG
jgi:hypothetical protein